MIKAAALLFLLAPFAHAQQRPAITGIAFVRMYAADPAASTAFYSGKLGFDEIKKDGITRYPVNDSQWLEVAPVPSPRAAISYRRHRVHHPQRRRAPALSQSPRRHHRPAA